MNNIRGWSSSVSAQGQFFILQLLHIAIFYFYKSEMPDAGLLFTSGVINTLLYSWLLVSDIRAAKNDISPFWFYLGMSTLRLGIGAIYVSALIWTGDLWAIRLGRVDPSMYLMEGHFLLLVGDYCFISGYFLMRSYFFAKHRNVATCNPENAASVYKAGLVMTITAFAVRGLEAIISFGGIGQIVSYVADYGVPAGIFIMFLACMQKKRWGKIDLFIPIGLLIVAVISSFSSYMKTTILISVFPVIIVLLELGRRRVSGNGGRPIMRMRYVAVVGVLGYVFFFVVSAYSELRRAAYWEGVVLSDGPIAVNSAPPVLPDLLKAIAGSVPGTDDFFELHQYPRSGVWHMISRLSVTPWAATSIKLVSVSGERPDSMIRAMLTTITPRIFWPDKPQISWGREVAVVLGQASDVETATTATALTMPGFLYWWGGYSNAITMTFLSGVAFAIVFQLFSLDWRINPISALVIMAMTYNGFHWKESDALGGFPFYIYMLIVFLPLSRYLGRTRFRLRHIPRSITASSSPKGG